MTQPEDQTIGPRLEAIRIRDALCDSFEQELLRGEKPKLDTYLAKADPRDRLQLLPELLALSRHHLSETGMRELIKEYLAQNPEHSNTIIDILRDETLNMEVTSMQVGTLCEQSKPGLYPGGTFGKFEILEEIARGGMGVIFKARQKDLDRVVALKVIISGRLASAEEIRRFEREACSVAALEHRNIISIYEVNQIDNLHYFTMKYFDGRDLNTWAKEYSPSLT